MCESVFEDKEDGSYASKSLVNICISQYFSSDLDALLEKIGRLRDAGHYEWQRERSAA